MRKDFALAVFALMCIKASAQNNSNGQLSFQDSIVLKYASTVTMAAGSQFQASRWKELWWGKHYRREWVTPVTFQVLDLSAIDGGLTPTRMGGGNQSKVLRLMSGNGREYVLRSIDKNLDVLIPEQFKETFLNDIVNDQISTAHPYGPIGIANLSESLGLPHTNPVIYYVPDDPRLGEFREIFANKLSLLEERPSGKGWDKSEQFANADDIVNTEKMLENVYGSSRYYVDQGAYLKVRLFDMLVNDWDRHEDQWVWAEKKNDGRRKFIPIARDRDQAFSKTDGISLYFLSRRWAFRPLQNMDRHVKDVLGANFAARNLDRQFLNQLDKEDWKRIIQSTQSQFTDSGIISGINSMPAEVNEISGDFLKKRLIQRRNNLGRDGMKYYRYLSKQVTINGSAEAEHFTINALNKREVAVTGIRAENDTFYYRLFNRKETNQINIYGLQGDDKFIFEANAKNKFRIRLLGDEGEDQYTTSAIHNLGKRPKVYDRDPLSEEPGKAFKVNRRWDTLYQYKRNSVIYDWYLPIVTPGYNPDDGFQIAFGFIYKRQQWGKSPFGWQQRLLIDYATETGAVGFSYKGMFKQTIGKWDLDLHAFYKGPRYTFNYYGKGNETELDGQDRSYFRTKANHLYISPGVSRTLGSHFVRAGLQFQAVELLKSQDKFVTSPKSDLDSSAFSRKRFAGINAEWVLSKYQDEKYQRNGFKIEAGVSYLSNINELDSSFLKINSAFTYYHSFSKNLTVAHRTGGSAIFGEHEFYHGATLGGEENLRGYWRTRFNGKYSFYQNTELRLALANLKGYVVRGKLGIFGFFDDGRVWVKDDNSSKLHYGYGGGVLFAPYTLRVFTLYYGRSTEAEMITLRAGFFF